MADEDYFDSLTHLRLGLQQLRAREIAAVASGAHAETDALAVWRDGTEETLELHRALVASVIKEVEVFSLGRGRRKPPEADSISITRAGADSGAPLTETTSSDRV